MAILDELFGKDHKAEAIHSGPDGNDNTEPSILPPPQYPPPSLTASSLLNLLSEEDSYYGTDMKMPPHANSNSLANSIEGRSTAAGDDAYFIKETGDELVCSLFFPQPFILDFKMFDFFLLLRNLIKEKNNNLDDIIIAFTNFVVI